MGQITEYKTQLRGTDIDAIARHIEQFLTEQELPRRDVLRLRLTMEELLLRIRDVRGRNTECVLALGTRLGRPRIRLSYAGEAFDPTVKFRESDGEAWSEQLLASLGVLPAWSWRRGVNRLVLHPPRKPVNRFAQLSIAIVLAVLLGLACSAADASWLDSVSTLVLTPLSDAFLGAMGTFVGLMIFFSVVCGICGIGDTSGFERIGRVVLRRFIGLTLLWSAIGGIVLSTLSYSLHFGPAVTGDAVMDTVLRQIYSIIPRDPVSPFLNGDSRQILFLAFLCGAVLLSLGDQAGRLRETAIQCNLLLTSIMERICGLIPLFVFITLLLQFRKHSLSGVLRMWKPLVVYLLGSTVILSIKLLLTCLKLGVDFRMLFRIIKPAYLLALSTASPAAVFGMTMDNCENKLGISHKLVLVSLPIGNILCAPMDTLCFSAVALYLAETSGIPVDAEWIVTLILFNAVLCLTLPPIPGAYLTCFGILLAQLGLPMEGLAVMAVLNVFLDSLGTASENAYLHMELAMQAKKLALLNDAALR